MSGSVGTAPQVRMYADLVPGDELRGRSPSYLERFTEQAVREAAELERKPIGDFIIDTTARTPEEAAEVVCAKLGL